MKTRWFMMSAVAAGLCLSGLRAAGTEDTVTLAVNAAPLEEVLDRLHEATGANIYAHSDIAKQVVSLKVSGLTLETVLANLAWQYNFKLEPIKNGWRLGRQVSGQSGSGIGPADGGAPTPEVGPAITPAVVLPPVARNQVPTVPAGVPSAGNVVPVHQSGQPEAAVARGPRVHTSIPLRYAVPSQIANWFGCPGVVPTPYGQQIVRRPASRPVISADLGRVNVPSGMVPTSQDVDAYKRRLNSRPTYRPSRVGGGTYAAEDLTRDQFGGMGGFGGGGMGGFPGGGMGGFGGGMGRPGMGGMGGMGGFGGMGGMGGMGGIGGMGMGGMGMGNGSILQLPDGIESLVGYDLLSALIVVGEADAIDQLRQIISIFDLPPKQIEVEARFVTLTVSAASSLGITWSLTDGSTVVGGATTSSGGSTLAVRTSIGNFNALLNTLQRNNQGKVVNAPKVIAQNAQPASVYFTQEIPYTSGGTSTSNAGGFQQQLGEIDTIDVSIGIDVTARVTGQPPNESITVYLSPEVDDIVGYVDNPNGGTIPIVASQTVDTEVRVPNGETIAMGGLVRKNNSKSGTSIPILGDLPFIGSLFRSHAKNDDESELLIFVTPTIIRERGVDYTVFGGAGQAAAQTPGQ